MTLGLQCGQVPPSEWLRDIGSQRDLESTIVMLRTTWGINDMTAENIAKTIFPIAIGDRELVVTMPDGWHWEVEETESE
jgi:hypothetical protein